MDFKIKNNKFQINKVLNNISNHFPKELLFKVIKRTSILKVKIIYLKKVLKIIVIIIKLIK